MHELPVTQNLLEMTLKKAEEAGAERVTELQLIIGDLSSFIDDSISFYWDILTKETIAEGSVLKFNRIPAEMLCLDCEHRYQPDPGELLCPQCEGAHLEVLAGDEFQLESILIEDSQSESAELEKVNK